MAHDAEEGSQRGTDSARIAPGGSRRRVSEICREKGISEATYCVWKKRYVGLALSDLRELRQLREENAKLKRLVGGSFAGPAHAAGDRTKKAVKSRHRRELGRWAQAAFEASERAGWRGCWLRGSVVSATDYLSNDCEPEVLIEKCRAALEGGDNLVIFPKGTRSIPGRPPHFQQGFAHIATMTGASLQPILITCEPITLVKGEPYYRIPDSRTSTATNPCSSKISAWIQSTGRSSAWQFARSTRSRCRVRRMRSGPRQI